MKRYNPNIKYCPLQTAADGLMAECADHCAWYIEDWEDEASLYRGRCAMQYLKAVFNELQSSAEWLDQITDSLQDINISLTGGVNPCR